ncbi:MAG: TetR/AcrR family transcriptional regulator [Deltaproteobacteria bacterium]|jgi:AcrR family transcriptional regulator|nr:TetR/AcrR family transcriptional regulator [Deltaproteobacteria bacterium]
MATIKKFPTYQYNILGETINLPLVEDVGKTKEIILVNSTILFAKKGYDAVSIRDIAKVIGIKPSSLYNHYSSKEALFEAVLRHAEDLYLLYFRRLDDNLATCRTLEEMVEMLFREPKKMANIFTCYAFSLIQSEQFRDERSGLILTNTFLEYSINFMKNWFDKCIDQGLASYFDTKTVSTIIMHSVLMAINLRVHECLDRHTPYSYSDVFDSLKQIIMKLAGF